MPSDATRRTTAERAADGTAPEAMRILHVLNQSLPLHSGYTFRTVSILREQRALGWRPVPLTTPRQGSGLARMEHAAGWNFHRTPYAPGWLANLPAAGIYLDEMRATARRLAELVQTEQPDVLHAHSPVLTALPALWVGRRCGLPVLYEVRACWEDAAVDHGTTTEGSLRYRTTRWLETQVARRVDALTVICDGLRREFEGRGIAPSKITVIPNAVDIEQFPVRDRVDGSRRRELRLDGTTVLGFVGSFYAYEGLDLLLRAVARLRTARPELRVLLVGEGYQYDALRRLAGELQLGDAVIFTGRVPHGDVHDYYDQMDLLVFARQPMRLTELVTPLKPLEAMAQGKVVLASDVGGHRELIADGRTGYLFEAGSVDALVRAIDDALARRAQWDALRTQARDFVASQRTWAMSVARYAPVYERLVAGQRAMAATRVASR